MEKKITWGWIVIVAVAVGVRAWGANGANLIGISPASSALGGTGVSHYTNETDALTKNPALLNFRPWSEQQRFTGELSGQIYKSSPETNLGAGPTSSTAGARVLPNFAASYRISPDLSFGLGGVTAGGGVVDYTGVATIKQAKMFNSVNKVIGAAAYRLSDEVVIGLAPFLAYGQLVLNEDMVGLGQSNREASGKFGAGVQLGVVLNQAVKNTTFGLTLQTKTTDLQYANIMNLSLLGPSPSVFGPLNGFTVQQPAEIALGLGYQVTEELKLMFDYRFIAWSTATGYSDLGWSDQSVFALGGEYQMGKLVLRSGFNYGKSPISNSANEDGDSLVKFQNTNIFKFNHSMLNMVAFPGISEFHITAGTGYQFTDDFVADLGLLYVPRTTITRSGTSGNPNSGAVAGVYTYTTSATQWAVAAGGTYRF